jgi:hypothetical protein
MIGLMDTTNLGVVDFSAAILTLAARSWNLQQTA